MMEAAGFGDHVQQHRATDVLDHVEIVSEREQVVAVDGTDVAETEFRVLTRCSGTRVSGTDPSFGY